MSPLTDELFAQRLLEAPNRNESGWSRLGQVLGGNGAVQRNAYMRGQQQGVQAADVLQQAQRRRDQNMGFSTITPELMARVNAGDPDAIAALQSGALHGGINYQQLGAGQGDFQKQAYQRQLMQQAQSGTPIQSMNPMLAVLGGKPVDVTKVSDGVAYNPVVAPGDQNIDPTAVGQSSIARAMAAANQSNAGAGKNAAEASLARARIPSVGMHVINGANGPEIVNLADPTSARAITSGGSPVGYKPSANAGQGGMKLPTGVDQKTVDFARSKLASGASPSQVQQFLINHGHAAVSSYLFGKNQLNDDDNP